MMKNLVKAAGLLQENVFVFTQSQFAKNWTVSLNEFLHVTIDAKGKIDRLL